MISFGTAGLQAEQGRSPEVPWPRVDIAHFAPRPGCPDVHDACVLAGGGVLRIKGWLLCLPAYQTMSRFVLLGFFWVGKCLGDSIRRRWMNGWQREGAVNGYWDQRCAPDDCARRLPLCCLPTGSMHRITLPCWKPLPWGGRRPRMCQAAVEVARWCQWLSVRLGRQALG